METEVVGQGRFPAREQGGFVLVLAMLLSGLAALLAAQALTRAQVDTRLAGQEIAAAEAEMAARGLLAALLEDTRAQLRRGSPPAVSGDLCGASEESGSDCRNDFPRVWALRHHLPGNLQVAVSVEPTGEPWLVRLPESRASGLGTYTAQRLEFRALVSGAASAGFAASAVAVQNSAAEPGASP